MAEASSDKPTLFSRLFGRKTEEPAKPDERKPGEAPAKTSAHPSASWTEGQPDFAAAAAAGEIAPVAPTETGASPDMPSNQRVPPELAGADLQPVEGTAPESRGAEPTGSSPPSEPAPSGWWRRLTEGMRRTSSSLSESVTSLFAKRKLDAATLEELEDALIQADLGIETAVRIVAAVGQGRYDKEVAPDDVKAIMAGEVQKVLEPVAKPLTVDRARKPFVVLMIGVNGSGKTTTIGKLAAKFRAQGLSVMLAAGDTFRAAAIEQLKVWGERTGAPVLAREQGADAAGLAFDALTEAKDNNIDVLLVDTAGRLQNKAGLMAELEKVVRVMKKLDASAPHAVLLVLDATVGQNALSQVELFRQTAGVTGLVMTKLDGTARGGILVALAAKFGVPVHFIGVGEGIEDLEPFAARDFARAIAGLEQAA